jgi:XapX domain-containing protein
MKAYILSLFAGLLVGVFYSLAHIRSPAPPTIALVGLFGILAGEQVIPITRNIWLKEPLLVSWIYHVKPHVFGHLPEGKLPSSVDASGPQQKRIGVTE